MNKVRSAIRLYTELSGLRKENATYIKQFIRQAEIILKHRGRTDWSLQYANTY